MRNTRPTSKAPAKPSTVEKPRLVEMDFRDIDTSCVVAGTLLPRAQAPDKAAATTARSRNKVSKEVKDVIARCFEDVGGRAAFAKWARNNRTEFYKMYSKMLPITLRGTGENGEFTIVVTPTEAKL